MDRRSRRSKSRSRSRSPSPKKTTTFQKDVWDSCCSALDIKKKDSYIKGSDAHTKVLYCYRQHQIQEKKRTKEFEDIIAQYADPIWLEEHKKRMVEVRKKQAEDKKAYDEVWNEKKKSISWGH